MTTQILITFGLGCLNCCFKEITEACSRLAGVERVAKFFYVMLDLLVVIPGIVLFYSVDRWSWFVKYFAKWLECPDESGGQ